MVSKTPIELIAIIAPEFRDPKYPTEGAIEVAKIEIDHSLSSGIKEGMYNLLIAYLACHTLTVGGRPMGSSGDVSSLQEGAVSISYSTNKVAPNSSNAEFFQTSFGREYMRLSSPYLTYFYI